MGRLNAQFPGALRQKCAQFELQDPPGNPFERHGTGHDALEHGRLRLLHDPRHEPEPGTLGDPDRMRVLVRLAGRRHFGDGCRHAARPHPRQSQIRPGGQGQGHHPLVAGRTGAGRHRKRQRRAGKLLGGVHRQANRHRNPRQGGDGPQHLCLGNTRPAPQLDAQRRTDPPVRRNAARRRGCRAKAHPRGRDARNSKTRIGGDDKSPGEKRPENELRAGARRRGTAGADTLQDPRSLRLFQRDRGTGRPHVGHVRLCHRRLRRQDRTDVRHRRRRRAAEHGGAQGTAVQARRTVHRRTETGHREDEHAQNHASALLRRGSGDGHRLERPGVRRRGEGCRGEKTAAGAGHHAPRSFHRRRGRGSGHGLCPRRRGRESRRENRRERIVLARRAVQQEHHARPERRGGRIVPPEGQQANRHREGTGHGCVVGRQLRVGNRAGRPGTEPLCDPVEGLCHRPGQDNGGKTAQGERQGEAGTFVDPAHRPFSAPRIPGEISPRLHRADHLGRLPATLPAFGRGVRREHVAGHRPQRQERAFAPGQLPALRRRIRLLERQYVEIRMGDGLRDALPDRGCETRLRRGQGDARPGAQIPAQQPLGLLPDPGLYPVCAGAERDSDPGCHEPAPGKGRLAK